MWLLAHIFKSQVNFFIIGHYETQQCETEFRNKRLLPFRFQLRLFKWINPWIFLSGKWLRIKVASQQIGNTIVEEKTKDMHKWNYYTDQI